MQRNGKLIGGKLQFSKKNLLLFGLLFAVAGSYFVWKSFAFSNTVTNPQTSWVACSLNASNGGPSTFTPLTNAVAASLVTPQPEIRAYNAKQYSISNITYPAPNFYVPSSTEINAFRNAMNQYGQTQVQANPYMQYVDGLDGMSNPSTDDLIQWGAHKWGIPENWLRAEYVVESHWNQYAQGDQTTVTAAQYAQYPIQSQIPGTSDVYQSLGITQERWVPINLSPGVEPLRWRSTAFNIDYQAATIRYYYDNPSGLRSAWGDNTYAPCQQWSSLGGWFNPYPWNNAGQQNYVSAVQTELGRTTWATTSFMNEAPIIPPAITFPAALPRVPGDCDNDGHVDVTDLSILLSHYGQNYAACDFNGDNAVNVLDLSILLSHYGT